MKIFLKFSIVLLVFTMSSCKSQKKSTFWVNRYKKNCDAGAGKMKCLQISKNDAVENAKWIYFYGSIDGFEFKPGYLQKIEVTETYLNKNDVPADASSIKYTLNKIIEEVKDEILGINDIWVPISIFKKPILNKTNLPNFGIQISQMSLSGNDGCNSFSGKITELTSTKIKFSGIAATQRMCLDMEITDLFNAAINKTTHYKKSGLKLYFFDEAGNEIMILKKVD